MQKYILVLLTVLILIIVVILFFGHRQLDHLNMQVSKNRNNISAVQTVVGQITHLLNGGSSAPSRAPAEEHYQDPQSPFDPDEDESEYTDDDEPYVEEDSDDGFSPTVPTGVDDVVDNTETDEPVAEGDEVEVVGYTEVGAYAEVEVVDDAEVEVVGSDTEVVGSDAEMVGSEEGEAVGDAEVVLIDAPSSAPHTPVRRGRRVPDTPAKELDVDTELLSENDGVMYVVTVMKNGVKRWSKKR